MLDNLLELQQLVLLKNRDTSSILNETATVKVGPVVDRDGSSTSVPEVSSDDESDEAMEVGEGRGDGVGLLSEESEPSAVSRIRRKRRKHRDWVGYVF